MNEHGKINYVEFASANLPETKRFFTAAFDWSFEDFGPDYTAFSNEGLDGGFYYAELSASAAKGSALVIFYSNDLKKLGEKLWMLEGSFPKKCFLSQADAVLNLLSLQGTSLLLGQILAFNILVNPKPLELLKN